MTRHESHIEHWKRMKKEKNLALQVAKLQQEQDTQAHNILKQIYKQYQEAQQSKPEEEAQQSKPEEEAQQPKPEEEAQQSKPEEEAQQLKPEEEAQQPKPEEEAQQFKPEEEPQTVSKHHQIFKYTQEKKPKRTIKVKQVCKCNL